MTQEQKKLLLKDLCGRLPYGIKVKIPSMESPLRVLSINTNGVTWVRRDTGYPIEIDWENCKPYLFPLSSMTEEQKRELLSLTGYEPRCEESCGFDSWGFYVNIVGEYKYKNNQESIILYPDEIGVDWLNKNHFDYRGLIENGLAIDCTNLNIY